MTGHQDVCAPFDEAMVLLGRRWAGGVVRAMLQGASRFVEIRDATPGITDRTLSIRLRDLEASGIIERHVVAERPVRADYLLTARGRALEPVLTAVERWATDWRPHVRGEQRRGPAVCHGAPAPEDLTSLT
ncbi:helix-turn-helix transcriptional regulator [Streptomyces sp. NBC_01754]|uniref:winged helix-turn-helix transcriptional regulator n=1 Tax=Streptomyces sp. NBC_01754 TaxID=2975930 RepID=UPI002DDA0BC8|nr:helix-turn-helix domain-containing protein [Streptomyces sp. NBC_01754]WSC95988.1 helix-turn-helix transcriptional regulator [Streptomyces sp. NBC_01754]